MPDPLCTNGSEPNPEFPPYVWVTWLDARSWLGYLWGVFNWLGLGAFATLHEINEFCATEPEQPVYPGDATVLAAATDPVAFEALLKYIKDSATWYVWSQACVCTAAESGTCYPVLPTGTYGSTSTALAGYQFGVEFYARVSGLICYGFTVRFASVGAGTFKARFVDQHDSELYEEDFTGVNGLHTYYFTTPQALNNVSSSYIYDMILAWPNSGYTFTYESVNVTPLETTQLHYNKFIYGNYPGSTDVWNTSHYPLDPVICTSPGPNPEPTTPDAPPLPTTDIPDRPSLDCTTTADLCDLLNNAMEAIGQLRGQVDLIQRQNVPFAYIIGTVHSGLSGSGTFSVQGLIGLLIQTSTIPSTWGLSVDVPARYIPAPVSVAVGDSAGDQDNHFCHLVEELWFPTDMGAMTTVSYAFRPGCGGAITELRREF